MATVASSLKRLKEVVGNIDDDAWIDNILLTEKPKPRRLPKPPKSEFEKSLEKEFLTPSNIFSTSRLNAFQKRWQPQTNYAELFQMAPTQTRTIVRFKREGLEGRVTGYEEVTVPASSATAKNSTSILRKPANRANFVRGAAGNFPFTPGGLEHIDSLASLEEEDLQTSLLVEKSKPTNLERVIPIGGSGSLLEIAPGLPRGMKIRNLSKEDEDNAKDVQSALEQEPEPVTVRDNANMAEETLQDDDQVDQELLPGDDDIDNMLPNEFPSLAPHGDLKPGRDRRDKKEWAHVVDINREITNFKELVPNMARDWPFELDTFQKEAIYHLENGDSVFVAAHTSAGKTVVAEYAIALAAKHMTKAIYTSPIKALSNQKFRDFKDTFAEVGILTGDVQINPEASCLIMTTEILRSMLYRGADLIRDVEYVIFDEVHYVNDQERGVVWEEVIIMLPENVTFILLSATVPNTKEFASWVGRTKQKNIYVISTSKRPVPLEHFLWAEKDMYKIVTSDGQFLDKGWKQANDIISGNDKVKALPPAGSTRGNDTRGGGRGRGNQRGGSQQRGGTQSGRGRGLPMQMGRGNIARTGRGGGRTSAQQEKTLWVHMVQNLRKKELLPACVFVFSKKRCEQNAESCSNLDFCTASEKSAIHMTIENSIARLKPEDRQLPQILRVRELLSRGFAVHHSGMLPILKEVVELLFAKALVKVLFATETFAMGLNLPTRTVVFSGFRKHDGKQFRDLLPGEYTQMAGRAGRRGLDPVGTVIIVLQGMDEAPPQHRLRQMMLGQPTKLRSQFRLTYNMILNLLRVEALQIEEMIKRSFSENATQALLPEHEKGVAVGEAELKKIKREPCPICDVDLEEAHAICIEYAKLNAQLYTKAAAHTYGRRIMEPYRLVVFRQDGIRQVGMIIKSPSTTQNGQVVQVMKLTSFKTRSDGDSFPFLNDFSNYLPRLPRTFSEIGWDILNISPASLECVTRTEIHYTNELRDLYGRNKKVLRQLAEDEVLPIFKSWTKKDWNEFNWGKVTTLDIKTMFEERNMQAGKIASSQCLSCPNFVLHFSQQHAEWLIKDEIARLRRLISDQNLALLPDYELRVDVLKELGFIDDGSRVELKGKVACEVSLLTCLLLLMLTIPRSIQQMSSFLLS
jgi:antiviral helicase SKI2